MPNDQADLDALLRSEDSASEDSQTQEQTGGANQEDPNRAEFNKLSGSTQDRVRDLIRRRNELADENEKLKALAYNNASRLPPPPKSSSTPDVQEALNKLREYGVVVKDDLKEMFSQQKAQDAKESRLSSLEQSETGQDGRPSFSRLEYEDYIRQHPQYSSYDPGDVFGIMYRNELIDWEVNHRSGGTSTTPSLRSSRSSAQEDVWTSQYVNDMIGKEGMAWYVKNFDKANRVLESGR